MKKKVQVIANDEPVVITKLQDLYELYKEGKEVFLTAKQVADLLRVAPGTIYRRIEKNLIPAIWLDSIYKISSIDLINYLEKTKTSKLQERALKRQERISSKKKQEEQQVTYNEDLAPGR